MAKEISISIPDFRRISGKIVRLGDDSDSEGQGSGASKDYTTEVGIIPCYNYDYLTTHHVAWHGRTLFEIDLSAIPRNSYIQSCYFRVVKKSWMDENYKTSGLPVDEITYGIYKAEAKPWDLLANMATYDGTNNWYGNGMYPNEDYYAVSALVSNTLQKSGWTTGDQYDIDLTNFARECMERDDQTMRMVWKAEESWEASALWDRWMQKTGENGLANDLVRFYGPTETNQSKRPVAIVVYTEPMAFFASNQDGTIDESREIFLGAGQYRIGTVVKDPNGTSYQENPAKIWLKNQLSNLTMKGVKVYSPPNWATFPEPDSGNTGNGTCSDVSTSPTLTIDEEWKVVFTSSTEFTVYRDSGTGEDPGEEQTWTQDGTGTVGTLYSSGTRGISFTITAGGTAFAADDKFYFTSYQDFSIVGAPTDSDQLLQISKDSDGSPDGNWYHARTAMTTLTQQVVSSTTLNVNNATYFNPSNKIRIFKRATAEWTQEYTIQSVNKSTHVIVIDAAISAEVGDWVHASPIAMGDMNPGSSSPFWARGLSFATTDKEEKYQYLRAQETI